MLQFLYALPPPEFVEKTGDLRILLKWQLLPMKV